MIAALLVAEAISGQAAAETPQAVPIHQSAPSYGPPTPPKPKPLAPVATPAADRCPRAPDPDSKDIVVCAPKIEGYRIDPDILAAKKAHRDAMAGHPRGPERFPDRSCAVVGPAGCMGAGAGVNLMAVAAVVTEIGQRLAKGQPIGNIFVTEPQMTEYQYYLAAKKAREAKEAEAAAKAAKAAAQAAAAAKAAASKTPPQGKAAN